MLVQPLQGVAYAGVDRCLLMAAGIGLHEDFQGFLRLAFIDLIVLDVAGQGTAHQYPRAIADPDPHRIDTDRCATQGEQHFLHRRRQVWNRIDQGTVKIEHHQPWQAPREQLLKATHGRASASSARIFSMTCR
ncbi:hypothetical protein D9M73_207440 [compost metagenome]